MERDNRGGHNRKAINENFFKRWTSAMAYILGFIYADGAVEDCRKSSRTCYLCLINNDLKLLKNILKLLNSNQTIQVRDPRFSKFKGKEYWCKTTYYVRIGNKVIYDDLFKIGLCPRKSLVIEMPKIPEEYFQFFLRGYFDGDGCINIEKKLKNRMNLIFTSGSKIFLEQLSSVINCVIPEIRGSISVGDGSYNLRYSCKNAILLSGFIYRDVISAPYLEYKYQKYLNYLNERNLLN